MTPWKSHKISSIPSACFLLVPPVHPSPAVLHCTAPHLPRQRAVLTPVPAQSSCHCPDTNCPTNLLRLALPGSILAGHARLDWPKPSIGAPVPLSSKITSPPVLQVPSSPGASLPTVLQRQLHHSTSKPHRIASHHPLFRPIYIHTLAARPACATRQNDDDRPRDARL